MDKWRKLGLRVGSLGSNPLSTHAMLPTPLLLHDRIRVFFSACDTELRGRIFYADLAREFPYPVLNICRDPSLDLGAPGAFDCDGVNPSCLVRSPNGDLTLYYIGWQRISAAVPYTLIAGRAVSSNSGESFERSAVPLLSPSSDAAFFRTAPFVWRAGDQWRMLYIGGGRFFDGPDGKRLPIYSLRLASSADGEEWVQSGPPLLEPDLDRGEIGFGRPVIWHDEAGAQTLMLSIRTTGGYRLMETRWDGASPLEGEFQPVVEPGPEAWDAEMTCFGSPLVVGDTEVLFYNGNRFGWTGFGIAWRPASGPSTIR